MKPYLFWIVIYLTKSGEKKWMYVKTEDDTKKEDVSNLFPYKWVKTNVEEFVDTIECDFQDEVEWDLADDENWEMDFFSENNLSSE